MPEFFLELFSEEIPARMQREAEKDLQRILSAVFHELNPTNIWTFSGPRRIAITMEIQSEASETQTTERGPRVTAPAQALLGFLRKHNATEDMLVEEDGYWYLPGSSELISAYQLIIDDLPPAITRLPWRKSMRWGGSGDFSWVRPLRSIICLLDGEIVPIEIGPILASNQTEGHRMLAPGLFEVSSVDDWVAKLRDRYVIADFDDRWQKIDKELAKKSAQYDLAIVQDDDLLNEVTGLVEWPVALVGKINPEFMDLPPEVRELSMKTNQRYFAMRDANGSPAPYFAFVANVEASDGGKTIIAGNERVLRARLSDARHFWDLDLKTSLDELLPKLDKITFHAKIGTQGERVKRVASLAYKIARELGADEHAAKQAEWAGLLSKADLVTGMVGEFPELQGIMGGYYAERNPRDWNGALVGPAIASHYQPKGPSDAVPTGTIAISVALADKLDTLIAFFGINEKPTGSGDPYALRRAALGIIRIILENRLSAFELADINLEFPELFTFILERLRVKLKNEGKRFDVLDASIAFVAEGNLFSLMEKVEAITTLVGSDDGVNLLSAYRRAVNILKIEDSKDGPHRASDFVAEFAVTEDNILRSALQTVDSEVSKLAAAGDYLQAMNALATLRGPIDVFFEKVTVNAAESELRRNRLALLAQLRDTMHQIADFSKIEG